MCGLAGAAGFIDDTVLRAVGRMNDAQAHRGPDAHGTWTTGGTQPFGVSLGHRRLAIVDLSPGGAQPMKDEDTGNVLCFNGEIYNHGALRDELKARGARFRSSSDTEVILHAYAAWGLAAVARFRGIFAFALWDARERALHLVRDPMGIKPLYWNVRGKTIYFGSELRALLASGAEPRLDPTGVSSFLWHGFVVGPDTMIEGVRLLPAATHATITDGALDPAPIKYWSLPAATDRTSSRESVAEALRESVRMQLMSDVPLGVFLSGGVDSTSVAVMACETGHGVIKTFNMGFEDPSLDESRQANDVAKALGTEHHSLRLTERDFQQQLPAALDAIDQPTFDGINTYLLSRAVRQAGITVALAGIGGDELFGGYRSFGELPRTAPFARALSPFGGLARAAMGAMTSASLALGVVPPQTRWGKAADVISSRGDFVDLYQTTYGLFSGAFFSRLGKRAAAGAHLTFGLTAERRQAMREIVGEQRSRHAVSELELCSYVRERLMRDVDAASMAVSLELRVPLLDHVVIEAVAGLPDEDRFLPLGRKQFLRQNVLSRLDPQIFERPKSGFVLPIDAWCRRGMREQMDSVYNDAALCERVGIDPKLAASLWRSFLSGRPGLYWSRVWAIFVLLHWSARHKASL